MATLVKVKNLITPLASRKNDIVYNIIRTKVLTNRHFMPGPRPKNEEEMKKAAEKYGLHPAEYKLYPDDGMHPFGDYPNLPEIGSGVKDPYYPYDYPDDRRNFEEPLHVYHNFMGEDRCDFGARPEVDFRTSQLVFWGVGIVLIAACVWAEQYPMFQPALKQQYPKPGLVHYTFEPEN